MSIENWIYLNLSLNKKVISNLFYNQDANLDPNSKEKSFNPNSGLERVIKPFQIDTKNGNIDELKNYRPISNLPFTSKILEKAAYIQLNHHH